MNGKPSSKQVVCEDASRALLDSETVEEIHDSVASGQFACVAGTCRGRRVTFEAFWLAYETAWREQPSPKNVPEAVVATWAAFERRWATMTRSLTPGSFSRPLEVLNGQWGDRLARHRPALIAPGVWHAAAGAVATSENLAGMGLGAAAPTMGAGGVLPGVISAASGTLLPDDATARREAAVIALLVAGAVGAVAFQTGPVSGAQAGCGGETGVAAVMASAAVARLLGGALDEIDAAGGLAAAMYTGLTCAPAQGRVEWPCVPRNGFAAVNSILAAEWAIAGVRPPYGIDDGLRRIFEIGRCLPVSLRETENAGWAESYLHEIRSQQPSTDGAGSHTNHESTRR